MKYFILSFLVVIGFSANSQYDIQLKRAPLTLEPNLNQYILSKKLDKTTFGRFYKIVQFTTIPSQEKKEQLENMGLIFNEYLPKNAYIVSFPKGFNKSKLTGFNIYAIHNLTDELRMAQRVEETPHPNWALSEGNIQLYITFHKDLNAPLCLQQFKEAGYPAAGFNKETSKVLTEVNVEDMYSLLNELYIRHIDLKPTPGDPEDDLARNMHRSSAVNTNYSSGRKYNGNGVSLCVNDDGFAGPHIDFKGRDEQSTVASDLTGTHGDMVAGIVGGAANLNPINGGMADASFIHVRQYSSALPNTVSLHVNDSVMAFNSSYSNGCNAGYTSLTQQVDQEIRLNPTLMQVFSAGNSNNNNCGYGAGSQWGNITGGHKIGKNVIACANLMRNETITTSSSRGPASDGRIKPDISSQGTSQISTDPNNAYRAGGGTSAAAPGITGIYGQMVQAYRGMNSGQNPESSLIKAILLNSADDIGNVGPDFTFGWGRVNTLNAIRTLEDGRYTSSTINQSGNNTHNITIPANVIEAKIMVYWMDYEGSVSAAPALVNDLNTTITNGGSTYLPWILDHTPNATTLALPATKGNDSLNNVEQISIVNPSAGTYTLNVNGFSVPQGPQKYWIIENYIYDEVELISPAGGTGYVPGETIRVFWDAEGNTGNFTFEYSTNGGSSWNTVTTSIPGSDRIYDWTVPNSLTGNAMARISRSGKSDVNDHPFSIAPTPTNIQITQVCPTYLQVSWNAVSGANEYEVYMLGSKFMDPVGRTTSTSFQIPITNPSQDFWVSVASIVTNSNSNVGRRAIAVNYGGGLLNCSQPVDGSVTNVSAPGNNGCASGPVNLSIDIMNAGLNSISNFPVKYQIDNQPIVTETYTASIATGNTATYTFTTPLNLVGGGPFTIKSWVDISGDGNAANDSMSTNYQSVNTINTQLTEDFLTSTICNSTSNCGATNCALNSDWSNIINGTDDDIDWRTNSGSTPSNNTGPSGDHTTGAGKYIYLEASNNCYLETATLTSPCIDLTGISDPALEFWYHMYGNSIGTLTVDVFDGTSWNNNIISISGDQGNQWNDTIISLSSYGTSTIQVRINGITGSSWASDIALDDISITSTTGIDNKYLNNLFTLYPNPASELVTVSFGNNKPNNATLTMYDAAGKMVLSQNINQPKIEILTNQFEKGIYFIELSDKSGISTKKLIIK